MKSVRERFEEKYVHGWPSECWPWTAAIINSRYGQFRLNGKNVSAHRLAYELNVGPIPEGVHVLHRCDNPRCVNHFHLFTGTNAENMADMVAKGRQALGESNARAKLDESSVLKIRADQRLHREIAADYDVSRRQISRIKCRVRWAHLE